MLCTEKLHPASLGVADARGRSLRRAATGRFLALGVLTTIASANVALAVPIALPGFPWKVDGPVHDAVAVADLDKDGSPEVVVTHGTKVSVFSSDSRAWPGWPVDLSAVLKKPSTTFAGPAAVGDVDGDGKPEIVLTVSFGLESDGALVVLNSKGQVRAQVTVPKGPAAGCTLADLVRPGVLDIVVGTRDSKVIAVDGNGAALPGFPASIGAPASSPVAAAPLARGQRPSLAVGASDGKVYVLSSTGKPVPGFPLVTHFAVSGAPAFGDIDDDGQFDLVVASQDFGVYAVKADGTPITGFPVSAQYRLYSGPALGDLDHDGRLDIVVGAADGKVYAWNHRGQAFPGFPVSAGAKLDRTSGVVLADFRRTGSDAILVTAADGALVAFDAAGKVLDGFPLQLGDGASPPTLGDVVRDDSVELLVGAASELKGFRLDRSGPLSMGPLSWPTPNHDAARQGRFGPHPPRYRNIGLSTSTPRKGEALRVVYDYYNLDGTPEPSTQIRWAVNGKQVPELNDRKEVPNDRIKRGDRWQVSVEPPTAGVVVTSATSAKLVSSEAAVQNSAPGDVKIRVEPPTIFATSSPKIVIATPSIDPDSDAVSYQYRWDRDGRTVSSTADLPTESLHKGERWFVTVTPTDGEKQGPVARQEFVVLNTTPTTPELRWAKPAFSTEDDVAIELGKPSVDPDKDALAYRYVFFVNGLKQLGAIDRAFLPKGVARRGDVVRVEVWANDGEVDSPHIAAETKITNAAPKAPTIAISPAAPKKGSELVAGLVQPSLDSDHDAVQYRTQWLKNGRPWGTPGQLTVSSAETRKGDSWEVEFTPFDGLIAGPSAKATVTIGNTAPSSPRLTASHFRPAVTESSAVSIVDDSEDPDGDVFQYVVTWQVDGKPAFQNESLTVSSATPAPVPTHPTTADFTRPDKAMPVEAIAKKQKGTHSAANVRVQGKTTLNPGDFRKGQRLVVSVVAVDTNGASSEPAMIEVSPRNTPPSRPTVAFEPATPTIETGLKANISLPSDDRDQDKLAYHYRWFRNGVYAAEVGDRAQLKAGEIKHGDEWRVVAVASDGEGESEPADMQTVVANTAPVAPTVSIAPAAPNAVTGLKCPVAKPATDADSDTLVLEYRWTRNGQPFNASPSTAEIPGHVVHPGESWQCDVVAFDGQARSLVASAKATVENAPPPSPVLTIDPKDVKTANAVKCLVATDSIDPDGDRVAYEVRWEAPAGVVAPKQDEANVLPAGVVKRGQTWQCVVVASDGKAKSSPVRAEVKVSNLAPIPPTLTIEPAAPAPGTDLRCVFARPATDPDGDRVTFAFSWTRNGVVQPFAPTSAEVPARLVKAGERWSCTVVASDGTDASAPARSSEVTVSGSK